MTVFVCEKCDSRWVGDMLPRRGSICFRCHVKTINLGFSHGQENFHGDTIREKQRKIVSDAAAKGINAEPVTNWM